MNAYVLNKIQVHSSCGTGTQTEQKCLLLDVQYVHQNHLVLGGVVSIKPIVNSMWRCQSWTFIYNSVITQSLLSDVAGTMYFQVRENIDWIQYKLGLIPTSSSALVLLPSKPSTNGNWKRKEAWIWPHQEHRKGRGRGSKTPLETDILFCFFPVLLYVNLWSCLPIYFCWKWKSGFKTSQ